MNSVQQKELDASQDRVLALMDKLEALVRAETSNHGEAYRALQYLAASMIRAKKGSKRLCAHMAGLAWDDIGTLTGIEIK